MTTQITGLGESGQPIVSPYEDPIAVYPTSDTNPEVDYRLCEYDIAAQLSCRRTNTIRALEAEYDTFVKPEMYWGYWDLFCQHEDHIYFYKEWMKTNIQGDQDTRETDTADSAIQSHITAVNEFLSFDYHAGTTLEFVQELFANPPSGFPRMLLNTPQFYQSIDVGTTVIDIDNLDAEMLLKIKNTFVDDINPLLANLTGKLYQVGETIYCPDYLSFETNPLVKLGVLMIATETTKYTSGNSYFFPFAPLTASQVDFVNSLALIESELTGEVVVVNL
jgi:hypothetical protein